MSTAPPRSGQRSTPAVPWHLARPGRPTGRSRQDWCWRRSAAASPLLPVRAPVRPGQHDPVCHPRPPGAAGPPAEELYPRAGGGPGVAGRQPRGPLPGPDSRQSASPRAPPPLRASKSDPSARPAAGRPRARRPPALARWRWRRAGTGGRPAGRYGPTSRPFSLDNNSHRPPYDPPAPQRDEAAGAAAAEGRRFPPPSQRGRARVGAKTTYTPPGPNAGSRRGACRRTPCAPRRPVLAAGRTRTSPPAPGTARAGAG